MKRLEKAIEADIIRAMQDLGFAVTKTSQPRPSMITRGVPDLYAAHPLWRIRIWIEVKRPGGKTTAYQDLWHETERAAGGSVVVARSVGDVLDAIAEMGAPVRRGAVPTLREALK